jgi:hypothetical protein
MKSSRGGYGGASFEEADSLARGSAGNLLASQARGKISGRTRASVTPMADSSGRWNLKSSKILARPATTLPSV